MACRSSLWRAATLCAALSWSVAAPAADALVATIARVKPSVVGIGTFAELRRPQVRYLGTGFAVGDGGRIATNLHVVDAPLDEASRERLVVLIGHGTDIDVRSVSVVARDPAHDLALLALPGAPLPTLTIDTGAAPPEGTAIAFTGYPIGPVLGLHAATHQGIVAALTPLAMPADNSRELSTDKLLALRSPYEVLQLDAIAYPGNSGSPVYRQDSGAVVGIINMVFVKGRKEDILRDPSAITYAIPARYLAALLAGR